MLNLGSILKNFPVPICCALDQSFSKKESNELNSLEEIRIRVNKPILLKFGQVEEIMNHTVTSEEILEILQHLCDNSIYSYQNQICNGYITIYRRTSCRNNR